MAAAEESRIGKGTKVSGNLHFHGTVRIEGEADGEIVGDEIVIAEGATVSAKITANRLTIAGTVSGELVVRQLNGQYKVKEPRLQALHGQATMLLNLFPRHAIRHVRREENKRADELADEALDAEAEPS